MPRQDKHGPYPTAPVYILNAIWEYAENHMPVGGFITAVLENNLSEAFGRADDFSLAGIFDIVRYVHWEIPGVCHGSPEKVEAWLTREIPDDYPDAERAYRKLEQEGA